MPAPAFPPLLQHSKHPCALASPRSGLTLHRLLPPPLPRAGKSEPKDTRGSPTYLDDAAPAGQAARLAVPGDLTGGRARGPRERHASRSPGRAGPGFVSGHAEAAVSVGNPAAVIARPPMAEATSPAATAAFPGSRFQGTLGAKGRARGGGQGPACGAPATLRHGRPTTRLHKAASPRPRRRRRLGPPRAAPPPRLGRFFRFFFSFFFFPFDWDVARAASSPPARRTSCRRN